MPTGTNKGRQPGHGSAEPMGNQALAEPQPDHLRNLVLNYLCHNCYLKTAEAFVKDSAVRHLDKDGDEIEVEASAGVGDGMSGIGSQGSADLSEDMIRSISMRQRIQFEILSGRVEEATQLLNEHFPSVLAEDNGYDEMEVSDENVDPSRLEYTAETVNPVHLSLNLRILGFIEACRTVPLIYNPPSRAAGSPMAVDTDVSLASVKRDPKEEDKHQAELLFRVQKLYATVNGLRKGEDRTTYLKELSNVGGLLAYTIPENSPMVKYLHQERRDRVAEQINSAILHHTNMPTVSHLELTVRYTHCLWTALHELRVKVPTNHPLSGLLSPSGTSTPATGDSSKELSQEASPFNLQNFLNART